MNWHFVRRWWFLGLFIILCWMFWPLVAEAVTDDDEIGYMFLPTFLTSIQPLVIWIVLGVMSLFKREENA